MTDTAEIFANTVDNFIGGDQESFRIIYEKTKDLIFSVVYRMLRSREEAEDLMHDIYIMVFEKRDKYDKKKASFKTWLYRIAVNHTLNHIKKKKWLSMNLFKFEKNEEDKDILTNIVKKEERAKMEELLDKVRPEYKVCLILNDIEERPYEEIAQILKINIGTVRSRIHRGRKQLLELYRKEVS